MYANIRRYVLMVLLLCGTFLFHTQTPAYGADGNPPTKSVASSGAQLYTYTTACSSNALRQTQGFIIPTGVSSVDNLYLYFHGTGDPSAESICTSNNFALCSETAKMAKAGTKAAVMLNLGYKKDSEATDLNPTKNEMDCYLNEAKQKIASVVSISNNTLTVVGHSMGSNSVLSYLTNGFSAEKTIILDGCWQDRCTKIAKISSAGKVFVYTTSYDGNDVQGKEAAAAVPDITYKQIKSNEKTFATHNAVPGMCFADHITNSNCYGKFGVSAVGQGASEYGIGKMCQNNTSDSDCNHNLDCEDSSLSQDKDDFCVCKPDKADEQCTGAYGKQEGETWTCSDASTDKSYALHYCVSSKRGPIYPITLKDGVPTITENSAVAGASVLSDISKAYTGKKLSDEELKALLQKPNVKINIPGLNFSDINIQGQLSSDETGNTYLNIPYLGEYLAAVYKYMVVIAGIFCVVRIMIGGALFALPDSSGNSKSSGKEMIKQAIVGLVITVSSYTILYSINPALVQFQNLHVLYTRGEPIPYEDLVQDNESTGAGPATSFGQASPAAAKNIGGLIEKSTFPACSKEAAQDVSKRLSNLNICVGPCHCAFTASLFLSFIGCGNPSSGSAPNLVALLNQKGWIAMPITKDNVKNLPVGMIYLPGHAGVSIGDGREFESGTGDDFFGKSAKGGSCPSNYSAAVASPGICSYCAKLLPEDPSTGRFGANGVNGGVGGGSSCEKNQGWQEAGVSRLLNFRVVLYPPKNGETQAMGCCKMASGKAKDKKIMSEILCETLARSSMKSSVKVSGGAPKVIIENGKTIATWDSSITTPEQCK